MNQNQHEVFVGIDVSSRKFDVAFAKADGSPARPQLTLPNEPSGFASLKAEIGRLGVRALVGCESTGCYHRALLDAVGDDQDVVELNPLTIKRFVELQLRWSTTDRTDANSIAQYLRTFRPRPQPLTAQVRRELQLAVRQRRRRVEERSRKLLRLRRILTELIPGFGRAFTRATPLWLVAVVAAFPDAAQLRRADAAAIAQLRTAGGGRVQEAAVARLQQLCEASNARWGTMTSILLEDLAQAITDDYRAVARLDVAIEQVVAEHLDEDTFRVLLSIPGAGPLTVATIIAEVGSITRFPTVDHFIGYCGLYPASKHSGEGVRRSRMVRKGNRVLRTQILLASTSARRYNPVVAAFYDKKKAEQKSNKCAGGAAARKFAAILYGVMKSGQEFRAP